MRLDVRVPAAAVCERRNLFLLMLAACAEMHDRGSPGETIATLDDFPAQLDLALDLVEAVKPLPSVRATMNGRPVANLTRLWHTLSCYRESLGETDPRTFCRRQAVRVGGTGGCPDPACGSSCSFICARCCQLVGEEGQRPSGDRLSRVAVDAEVDWCPNLPLFRSNENREVQDEHDLL
ncbi:MAG: hypothetical protein AB7G48_11945 [Nitrospiraceae bacterium]